MRVFEYLNSETLDSIQIISQYTAQVSEIKRRMRDEGFVDENVTTVDSIQGGLCKT
jgi:superfamily I DNA and/or RNA helicase